jgi:hypothetical protein
MSDLSNIAAQFADIVRCELDSRETDATARIAQANLVTALLAKPVLALPNDLMVLTGCEKSTAYKIMAHPKFPETFVLARQKFCCTAEFMAALQVIGKPIEK